MNELHLEHWPLDRLIEYSRNPRRNDDAVDQMVGAIMEFGFRIPIIARSDGLVVDGHLRLKAARRLELDSVPVVLADELSEAQIKAFRLLANKSANWAEWDEDLLALELSDLQEAGFDLGLTGFDDDELQDLLYGSSIEQDGLTEDDAIPEVPSKPVTRRGDLWLLGDHRLLCGDSTDPDDVMWLMNIE